MQFADDAQLSKTSPMMHHGAQLSKTSPMMQPAPRRRWTKDEDARLSAVVETHGAAQWADIENVFGGGRTAAMCRERWHYHLHPDVRKRNWLPEEDALIRAAMPRHGRWAAAVSKQLRGRSAHAVRNRCALLCNHAARSREQGAYPPLDDSTHGKVRAGAQPAAVPDPARAQPERATLRMPHGGDTFFGSGSFGFVSPSTHGTAPPTARLLQPANDFGHWWGTVPVVQQAMPVTAPMFPRAPSFDSFESTTTRTMISLSFIPPPPQPAWLALGPAAATADTEGKIPFMAAVGLDQGVLPCLDATLEGNSDAWIAAIDAAILELGV
jgi:hypothetical protein